MAGRRKNHKTRLLQRLRFVREYWERYEMGEPLIVKEVVKMLMIPSMYGKFGVKK